MDRVILEAQLATLQAEMLIAAPGSVQQVTIEAQITTIQNELADEPVTPPIFGPHGFHGGQHGGHGQHGR